MRNKTFIALVIMWLIILLSMVCVTFLGSCTAGITMGRGNSVTQTVTNQLDSTSTTFKVGK